MSTLKVAAINNPSAPSGGLAISTAGNVTGAGLDLIVTQTFSAASAVSVNNCFSASYDNYRVVLRGEATADSTPLLVRLRVAGVDAATNYTSQFLDANGTVVSGERSTNPTTSWANLCLFDDGGPGLLSFELSSPAAAARTGILAIGVPPVSNAFIRIGGGTHSTATAYDGLSLVTQAGTITGTLRVYGYRN